MNKIFAFFITIKCLSYKTFAYAPTRSDIYDAMGLDTPEPSFLTVFIICLFFGVTIIFQIHDFIFRKIPGFIRKNEMNEKIRKLYLAETIKLLTQFKNYIDNNFNIDEIYQYYTRKCIKLQVYASDLISPKYPEINKYCTWKQFFKAIEEDCITHFLYKFISEISITAITDYDLIYGQIDIAIKFANKKINSTQASIELQDLKTKIESKEKTPYKSYSEERIQKLKEALKLIENIKREE